MKEESQQAHIKTAEKEWHKFPESFRFFISKDESNGNLRITSV